MACRGHRASRCREAALRDSLTPSSGWRTTVVTRTERHRAAAGPGESELMSTLEKSRVVTMDKITALCKRRGFVFPGSDIYGGLANTWDYGPLGVELKSRVKQQWWKTFVRNRSDMVGQDAAILMHPRVWEAS